MKVEQTDIQQYDFILIYSKNIENKEEVQNILQQNGFDGVFYNQKGGKRSYYLIRITDYSTLLKQAENIRLEKEVVQQSQVQQIESSQNKETTQTNMKTQEIQKPSLIKFLKQGGKQKNIRLENFKNVLSSLHPNVQQMEKYKKFKYENRYKFCDIPKEVLDSKSEQIIDQYIFATVFSSAEQMLLKHSILQQIRIQLPKEQVNFIEYQKDVQTLSDVVPIHNEEQLENINSIEDWLLLPILIGIITEILDSYFLHKDADHSPFESVYCLFIVFWASAFYTQWKRKEYSLRTLYRSFSQNFKFSQQIHHYDHKELAQKVDKITGETYHYFPKSKRLLQLCITLIKIVPIIAITLIFHVISLNIRDIFDVEGNLAFVPNILHVIVIAIINGYYIKIIEDSTKNECHDSENKYQDSIIMKRFIFEFFSYFTDLFFIAFMKFDILALKKSLISLYSFDEVRRVVSENIIPFIQNYTLHNQKDIILGYVSQVFPSMSKYRKQVRVIYKSQEDYYQRKIKEVEKPKYESFDDYIEIIINFGYLVLFASAFTLAPLLIFIFNFIELQSDKFKIIHNYRRPVPKKAKGIGSWNHVLNTITIMCVVTNIVLFAFSSEQIVEFFPSFFVEDTPAFTMNSFIQGIKNRVHQHTNIFGGLQQGAESGDGSSLYGGLGSFNSQQDKFNYQAFLNKSHNLGSASPAKGKARYVVAIVFAIEHIVFFTIWLIRKYLNSRKDWTSIYYQRKEYAKKIKN